MTPALLGILEEVAQDPLPFMREDRMAHWIEASVRAMESVNSKVDSKSAVFEKQICASRKIPLPDNPNIRFCAAPWPHLRPRP